MSKVITTRHDENEFDTLAPIEKHKCLLISFSMSGHRIPEDTSFMYVGTKVMVRALTEGLRKELKAEGSRIRVASISPGLVETEFEYRCFANNLDTAKSIYESIKCMEPEDIVQAILYVLGAPQRVEVHDILLRPLEQKV
ncbi:hypothetical protein NPIL_676951 [Nephila pilipes]|uniref:Dehydrogenase/reductase SDR family member 11 n=1 Tax=Nephila pilipes TaxID=299642 RepID=A0A8X6PY24_NEPPI|nr:hypothetical protein NPIL_676951 [Nephila pilipes]